MKTYLMGAGGAMNTDRGTAGGAGDSGSAAESKR